MQKQHIWIHESKCGELYADTGLNSWFLSVRTVELRISPETENPWLRAAPSDPDVLRSEAQRKFNCTLGNGKGEKESGADTPRQSVGKISHGSTIAPVLSDAILAHVLLFSTPSLLTHSS